MMRYQFCETCKALVAGPHPAEHGASDITREKARELYEKAATNRRSSFIGMGAVPFKLDSFDEWESKRESRV